MNCANIATTSRNWSPAVLRRCRWPKGGGNQSSELPSSPMKPRNPHAAQRHIGRSACRAAAGSVPSRGSSRQAGSRGNRHPSAGGHQCRLDLSKIEAGKFVLDTVDFCASQPVCKRPFHAAGQGQGKPGRLQLICEPLPPLPGCRVIRRGCGRLLLNYAGNAIKFTEQGRESRPDGAR